MKRKAFITTWHTPHQSDMINALKDDVEFHVLVNTNKKWAGRDLPVHAKFVGCYDPAEKYDYAIVNLDQQAIREDLYKGQIFRQLIQVIKDIPVIVLQHGSPVHPEYFAKNGMNREDAEKEVIRLTQQLVGHRPMVVNSYTAASKSEWGFGYPIVHGMDSEYWKPAERKENRVITALSPGGFDAYYNRDVMLEFGNILKHKYGYRLQWARVDKSFETTDSYRDWLASSLIYVDTSIRTPMNRARTEAMLSGCAVVQVDGCHDQERFFVDGENIVLAPNNPERIADIVWEMLQNREKTLEIGRNARKNAIKHFNYERYRQDWLELLTTLNI